MIIKLLNLRVIRVLTIAFCFGVLTQAKALAYTVSVPSISGFSYEYENGPSAAQFFLVSDAFSLSRPYTITAPTGYEVSTNENSGYSSEITIPGALISSGSVIVYIRLESGLVIGNYNGTIAISAPELLPNPSVSESVSVSGEVVRHSTTWNGTSWSNSQPNENSIVEINADYITNLQGNINSWSLQVNAGHTLSVGDNTHVSVTTDVVVDGTITVAHYGAFVQVEDTGTFTVNVGGTSNVVKQTAQLNNWYNYTYWSSPVVGETAGDALSSSQYRFVYNAQNYLDVLDEIGNTGTYVAGHDNIDDDGNDWQSISDATVLQPGTGYAATHTASGFSSGTSYPYTFSGPFNTGDITTPIYYNGDNGDNDWNMIGNPYPSAISVDAFFTENTGVVSNAVYLWSQASPPSGNNTGNETLNFNTNDYAVINGSGQIAGGSGIVPCRYIPSGQSFFIQGLANANVTFTNSMRMGDDISNNQFFRDAGSCSPSAESRLWVNLTNNNGAFNQTLVAYVNGATDGEDSSFYDAEKNLASGANAYLYSLINETDVHKLAIQGKAPSTLTENEIIPLGFIATEDAQFTISIPQLEGDFLNTHTIYLRDNFLSIEHDLSSADYTFNAIAGEHDNRFEIVFTENSTLSVSEAEINDFSIYNLDRTSIKVKHKTQDIAQVKLYTVLGQVINETKANNNEVVINTSQLSKGNYIIETTLTNHTRLTKKFIKQF
ncbi:T9SS type A sorting domain-containing protein [Gaetbulibacter jejuensis]|uniref:T9SS type A sorting domain-containing protein n=1 Tax=Gaetbulibacter jejuensis TaxID=584607 RepID=UPI003008A692